MEEDQDQREARRFYESLGYAVANRVDIDERIGGHASAQPLLARRQRVRRQRAQRGGFSLGKRPAA